MFIIFGNVQFVPGKYAEWQAAYDKLAEYVAVRERTSTLTYYFGIPFEFKSSFDDTPQMLAFEAYNTREDLYETHLNSPAMQQFLAAVPSSMSTGLDLTHYTETSGFLDKSGTCAECEVMYDTRIECHTQQGRNSVIRKLAAVAEHAVANDDGTSTFLVLQSLDSGTHLRIFERFASWKALLEHQRGEKLVNVWLSSKGEIKSMEGKAYVPNGKGWLHH
ncbi:hypothetical protein BJX61DRAFT_534527 [Aspergillus egyptiacus]|nr:hypothetical protein BJX61DRAFT_534527 [Aspergillus egyptiacus]